MDLIAKELTLKGWIVLMPNCFGHIDNDPRIFENKEMLDLLHKQKIDLSYAIYVINKDNYIGESTQKEIEYAKLKNKLIYFLKN